MRKIALLGAGFSRNWGGFLAQEAYDYLIGCKEVRADSTLQNLLHRHSATGGFEATLAQVQGAYLQTRGKSEKETLDRMQSAVGTMFDDMDAGFAARTFEPQNEIKFMVRSFLLKFDAIYSLNQDCLPEIHYLDENVMLGSSGKWGGWQLPGMKAIPDFNRPAMSKTPFKYSPDEAAFRVDPKSQAFVKLHGSHNWRSDNGDQLVILGANKSAIIAGHKILSWYFELFEREFDQPVRLMVIGYGFRDQHVNEILLQAARARKFELFIVDLLGASALDQNNNTKGGMIKERSELDEMLTPTLVGSSSRPFLSTFDKDRTEHSKIMRFFN